MARRRKKSPFFAFFMRKMCEKKRKRREKMRKNAEKLRRNRAFSMGYAEISEKGKG